MLNEHSKLNYHTDMPQINAIFFLCNLFLRKDRTTLNHALPTA